jgi:hypothetical protein
MSSGAATVTIPAEQVSPFPFPINPGDRIMTLAEWRQLRRISASGEWRLRAKGLGPKLTHLSECRLGVTVRDDQEWLAKGGAAQAAE